MYNSLVLSQCDFYTPSPDLCDLALPFGTLYKG